MIDLKTFLISFLLICSIRCDSGDKGQNDLGFDPELIKVITVENLTCDLRISSSFQIEDFESITRICAALNQMKPAAEVALNIHHCAYVLHVDFKSERIKETIGLVYTVFDGVVINLNGNNFKNDDLEKTLLAIYFKKKNLN